MERFLFGICLALCLATTARAQTPVTIDLGPVEDVATLYSYPNCAGVCPVYRTLPETVKHYLSQSLKRDGFDATTVDVYESAGRIGVRLAGPGAADYAKVLPAYLKAGTIGLKGARELLDTRPDGHRLWRYNWRFFLPHGVALVRYHTVQLLHFPPDSVLLDKQDYLAASTTTRWTQLLMKNSAAAGDIGRFQNIIDIVPVALPDRDSCYLDPRPPCAATQPTTPRSGVYPHFDNYIKALLNLWLPQPDQATSRPLIAFGVPVRNWLKDVYNVDLQLLQLGEVTLPSGMKVKTLAANHPSRIWHVKDDPNTPQSEQLAQAIGIMRQDLTAACWQVKMGTDANAVADSTLSACRQTWVGREKELCELSYIQVFNLSEEDAHTKCANLAPNAVRSIGDAELDRLQYSQQ